MKDNGICTFGWTVPLRECALDNCKSWMKNSDEQQNFTNCNYDLKWQTLLNQWVCFFEPLRNWRVWINGLTKANRPNKLVCWLLNWILCVRLLPQIVYMHYSFTQKQCCIVLFYHEDKLINFLLITFFFARKDDIL